MMMDVNGLKIINDAFGHGIGDSALKMIGNALKDTFKEKDIVSRIGGDEFAVLLPNTTRNKLQEYNEQIVSKVKTLKVKNVELSLAVGYEFKKSISEEIDDILELAENRMYSHKTTEGTSVRGRAINAILETLTDKYDIEREHSQRVSQISVLIAKALTLMRAADIKGLEQAGLFHDIGKISIPDKILNKPGKLTNEEYDIIKTHTEVGYQILRAADEYSGLAIHALHHHEHWDGSGYPKGLKGKDIPLFSRIICVADAYDAMTSDRPYRKKMSEEFAISEIKKCSGTQFDPKIANIFLEKVVIKLNEK
jgi:diguanylate cyclase (GGDEF)-like protein/putative nucleotidyltransferase with HDIG domain